MTMTWQWPYTYKLFISASKGQHKCQVPFVMSPKPKLYAFSIAHCSNIKTLNSSLSLHQCLVKVCSPNGLYNLRKDPIFLYCSLMLHLIYITIHLFYCVWLALSLCTCHLLNLVKKGSEWIPYHHQLLMKTNMLCMLWPCWIWTWTLTVKMLSCATCFSDAHSNLLFLKPFNSIDMH